MFDQKKKKKPLIDHKGSCQDLSSNKAIQSASFQATPSPTSTSSAKTAHLTPKIINSGTSFVKRHLQIQRRKTIHDIINFDLINNLIASNSFSTNNNDPTSTETTPQKSPHSARQKLSKNNSHILTDKNLIRTIEKANRSLVHQQPQSNLNPNLASESPQLQSHITRELLLQSPVQLSNVSVCYFSFLIKLSEDLAFSSELKFKINLFRFLPFYGQSSFEK